MKRERTQSITRLRTVSDAASAGQIDGPTKEILKKLILTNDESGDAAFAALASNEIGELTRILKESNASSARMRLGSNAGGARGKTSSLDMARGSDFDMWSALDDLGDDPNDMAFMEAANFVQDDASLPAPAPVVDGNFNGDYGPGNHGNAMFRGIGRPTPGGGVPAAPRPIAGGYGANPLFAGTLSNQSPAAHSPSMLSAASQAAALAASLPPTPPRVKAAQQAALAQERQRSADFDPDFSNMRRSSMEALADALEDVEQAVEPMDEFAAMAASAAAGIEPTSLAQMRQNSLNQPSQQRQNSLNPNGLNPNGQGAAGLPNGFANSFQTNYTNYQHNNFKQQASAPPTPPGGPPLTSQNSGGPFVNYTGTSSTDSRAESNEMINILANGAIADPNQMQNIPSVNPMASASASFLAKLQQQGGGGPQSQWHGVGIGNNRKADVARRRSSGKNHKLLAIAPKGSFTEDMPHTPPPMKKKASADVEAMLLTYRPPAAFPANLMSQIDTLKKRVSELFMEGIIFQNESFMILQLAGMSNEFLLKQLGAAVEDRANGNSTKLNLLFKTAASFFQPETGNMAPEGHQRGGPVEGEGVSKEEMIQQKKIEAVKLRNEGKISEAMVVLKEVQALEKRYGR